MGAMSNGSRTVLITGGGRGLGRATVDLLTAAGERVVALEVDPALCQSLEATADVTVVRGDVTRSEDVQRAVEAAGGEVDVLINNAGVLDGLATIDETDDATWARVLAVNLTGVMQACRAVVPGMVARGGGVIVNVASAASLGGGRAGTAYTASKWGVVGLTQNIAASHGARGVRCNAICPGAMSTGISDGQTFSERGIAMAHRDRETPAAVDPELVARMVVVAAGDQAAFVNGAIIPVDGGWVAY